MGSQLRRVRACAGSRAVRADGDRGTHRGLRAPRSGRGRRPAPLRRRRALRLGDGAAGRCRSGGRHRSRRVRGLSLIAAAAKARDTVLVSAGSDGVPTTADRAALLALLDPLRDRRDIVLVDARGSGRSGRVGDPSRRVRRRRRGGRSRCRPGRARRRPRRALRGRRRRPHRARVRRPLRRPAARAGARRRAARHAVRRRRPRRGRTRSPRRSARIRDVVKRLAARLRVHPLHAHGRIDDDVLARLVARGDARAIAQLPAAATAALHGDAVPLARLVAAATPPAAREAAQARPPPATTTFRPPRPPQVDGGPFTGATWLRALGLAACKNWPAPAAPEPVVPAGAALAVRARARARRRTRRRSSDDGRCARSPACCRPAGSCACAAPAHCLRSAIRPDAPATLARAFLQTRGHVEPGLREPSCTAPGRCAPSRSGWQPPRRPARRDAHGRDRSTLSDRHAATAAALGVADALAGASAPGAPDARAGSARRRPRS